MLAITGLIGIGNRGLAMALRLRDRARDVRVLDIDAARVALAVAQGARAAAAVTRASRRAASASANDFLSKGLCEAVLMTQVMGADFACWWRAIAPDEATFAPWMRPATVSSRTDAQLVHADGPNLSRAWCLGVLTQRLPAERARFERARAVHLVASLPGVTEGDFVATHGLVTYALFGLTGLRPK